jgi:hypothetical protein
MDLTALLLSRLQFAFTVSFHIIFPTAGCDPVLRVPDYGRLRAADAIPRLVRIVFER